MAHAILAPRAAQRTIAPVATKPARRQPGIDTTIAAIAPSGIPFEQVAAHVYEMLALLGIVDASGKPIDPYARKDPRVAALVEACVLGVVSVHAVGKAASKTDLLRWTVDCLGDVTDDLLIHHSRLQRLLAQRGG